MLTVGIPDLDRGGAPGYYMQKLLQNLDETEGVETVVKPGRFKKEDVDILHFNFSPIHLDPRKVNSVLSLLSDYPKVATVHGNEIFTEPDLFDYASRAELQYRRVMIPFTARFLDGIIAVSDDSADRLSHHLNCSPKKMYSTRLGVDLDEFRPVEDASETVKQKYGLDPGYVLHLSNYSQRKNPEVLIESFKKSKDSHDRDLVIAGGRWKDNIDSTDRIHTLGRVPQEDLPAIYGAAALFFYPTLEEAFGLPNLEAMACGTAVLSSNVYSVPEVVGDTGVLLDPENADEFAEEIVRLLNSEDLRTTLAEQGRERALNFTWKRTAEKTVQVYKTVLDN